MKHCKITYLENGIEKTKVFETLSIYKYSIGLNYIMFNNKPIYIGTDAGVFSFLLDNIDNYK